MDYRVGIDVMTTETTTCLSSVWQTDQQTKTALTLLGRGNSYQSFLLEMAPTTTAYLVTVDLDQVEPMIALPFHPPMPIPSACFGKTWPTCSIKWRAPGNSLGLSLPPPCQTR